MTSQGCQEHVIQFKYKTDLLGKTKTIFSVRKILKPCNLQLWLCNINSFAVKRVANAAS